MLSDKWSNARVQAAEFILECVLCWSDPTPGDWDQTAFVMDRNKRSLELQLLPANPPPSLSQLFDWNSHFTGAVWLSGHRSVLVITKSVLLTFSRDCAAENRHIVPPNLAPMGTWFLLVLRGCAAPFPWPYNHLPGEKALERVGGLATGLLLMWMGTGEGAPGTRVTPVPVSRACSTLREKFLHFYGCLTLNTEK